ncbi:MAG: DUF3179 domain-containing (seleno)protein [Schleiferiaceae bacterium]|nr:DUF3179 domain-containing (seleno)protein [Schleiferiaceae bacterium]
MCKRLILFLLLSSAIGCKPEPGTTETFRPEPVDEWAIPKEEVLYQNQPLDRIPSVDSPQFVPLASLDSSFFASRTRILVYRRQGTTKLYPYPYFTGHEIVNDRTAGHPHSITVCPLTESSLHWLPILQGDTTTFGVSGRLYQDNLMPYDRATGTIWSQLALKAVNGPLIYQTPERLPLLEISWHAARRYFPGAQVMDHPTEPGFCLYCQTGNEPSVSPNNPYLLPTATQNFVINRTDIPHATVQRFRAGGQMYLATRDTALGLMTVYRLRGAQQQAQFQRAAAPPAWLIDTTGQQYDLWGKRLNGTGPELAVAQGFFLNPHARQDFFPRAQGAL